ncbi:MAG TPA: hypothetical protein VKK61_00575 [Tepidisphaeraceae bacterium]|nr:hypothetical protein [Tepidisphaeraceae bacterium]
MSDLRKQLDAAKNDYRSLRYPGDLSAEILQSGHRMMRWLWPIAAVAAAAAIFLALRTPTAVHKNNNEMAIVIGTTQPTTQAETESALLGAIPSGISLAPPACEFEFSPPSFSLTADQQKQTSTSKESV